MTRPLFEPTQPRKVAANEWGVDQLYRRPAPKGIMRDSCYPATLTTVTSDATTTYHEYMSFTVPADDCQVGDYIELTLACELENTQGNQVYLVQEIIWGPTTIEPYPSLSFTNWRANFGGKFIYRLLFQVVDLNPDTHVWMSDLRCQFGPYSMGFGTDTLPVAISFNALELGLQDLTADMAVSFSARWTKEPTLNPAGTGATLTPRGATVRKFGCSAA